MPTPFSGLHADQQDVLKEFRRTYETLFPESYHDEADAASADSVDLTRIKALFSKLSKSDASAYKCQGAQALYAKLNKAGVFALQDTVVVFEEPADDKPKKDRKRARKKTPATPDKPDNHEKPAKRAKQAPPSENGGRAETPAERSERLRMKLQASFDKLSKAMTAK